VSIINETLNRLEMESPAPARDFDRTRPSRPAPNSMGLAVKLLATATLVVIAGTSLMVWHWNDRLGSPTLLSQAEAGSHTVPGGEPAHQPSPVPVGEQSSSRPQSGVHHSESSTAMDQPSLPPGPGPAEVVSEAREQDIQTNGRSLRALPGEDHLAAANVTRGAVSVESTESEPEPAASPAASPQQQQKRAVQPAVAGAPTWEQVLSEIGGQPSQVKTSSAQVRSGKKTVATANVKPPPVKARTGKAKPAPAAPEKQRRTAKVVATSHTVRPSAVDDAVERARVALSREQYPQALDALETLSPVPERRPDFWLVKGSAHLGLGQLAAAEQAFASAQPLAPGNAQIAVQRAIIKQEEGDHASALQILQDAAVRHPDVPEIFLNQGYSQQALGAIPDARRSFHIFLRMTEGRSLYAQQRQAVSQWLGQFSSNSY